MIYIEKNPYADTRSCDYETVTKDQLLRASRSHISDVHQGLRWFSTLVALSAQVHDEDKITDIDAFHADFITGMKGSAWLQEHYKKNRHHLLVPQGTPVDVNLIDVFDFITDMVMAKKARGTDFPIKLDAHVLQRAFENTVKLLEANVEVLDSSLDKPTTVE